MFKTLLFLIIVILTSISFCLPAYCFEGAMLPPAQEELTSYQDEILQFTLQHPPSWKPVSQDYQNRHFLVFFSPIEGNDDQLQDNLSCSVENLDQPVTPDAYLKKSLDAFQNQITQLAIGNTFEVSIANQKALAVPFTGTYQNNQLAWILVALVKDNQAFSFLLTSEPQKIETYWTQANQIISSIRFQEKTTIPIFLAPSTPPKPSEKSLQMPTFSELQEKILVEKPPIKPPSGKILYASEERGGNFTICTMNADGSNRTRLSGNHHTLAWQPSWSPNGQKIVFTSYVDFHFEIYLMNADGSGETMLTGDTEEKSYPAWSPDGTRIIFSSKPSGSSSSGFDLFGSTQAPLDSEIYIMNADGSNRINISNDPSNDVEPSWSPDGNKIAFATDRDGNYEIYVMNADGSNPVRITENFSDDHCPMWSPDGTQIAFSSNRDGNYEIYVMNADGKQAVNLTKNGFTDSEPAWSPDGKKITFSTNRDGNYEIYLMDTEGKNLVRLTQNDTDDGEPCWSPDGTKIAFTSHRDGNNDIFTMNVDGSNCRNLTRNPADDTDPAWSPDGDKIVFSTNRNGNYEIYLMDIKGNNQQNLTHNPGDDSEPCWSPDGKHILFTSNRSGTHNLFLLKLGQEYAEPFFLKGYMAQVEYFLKYLSDTAQPDDTIPNVFQQILTSTTNLITQLTTYQLEFIEKPKYLIVWQADWVRAKE